MAQHDYVISDQSFPAFRADINNGMAAIVSQNSGTTEPAVTYAYMPWADTTAGQLKIRNAANNAWIVLGSLSDVGLGLLSRAGGTMTGAITFAGSQPTATTAAAGIVRLDSGISSTSEVLAATPKAVKDAKDNAVATAASSAAATYLPAATAASTYLPLAGAGYRNLLINGNPIINQRGYTSGAATTGANQYTLDRWRVVTSGQSISWTDSANVRTVTAPAGGVEQVIEGLSIISGTYTLNWTGTATATVGGTAVAKGGNVTLTGGANATVRFSGGTFSLAQLEPGTIATPFERRSYGAELALCQRYFFAGTSSASLNPATVTTNISYVAHFPVAMRVTPAVTGFTASFSTSTSVTAFQNTAGSSWAGNNPFTASAEL